MKKIIDGVTYNTDTSTVVGRKTWEDEGHFSGRPSTGVGTLYQTRGGAFFVDEEETRTVWNARTGDREERVEHNFLPLDAEHAQKWLLEGETEVVFNPFEDPPEAEAEAEPGATIYVRVPAALKRQVDDQAKSEKVSGNVWAMRCIERCLAHNEPSIHDDLDLFAAWHIATTDTASGCDWSLEKALGALGAVANLLRNRLEDKYGKRFDDGSLLALEHHEYQDLLRSYQPYEESRRIEESE